MTECCCDEHNMEIDAELFAGHMRNLLTNSGVDTREMSNDFIGTTSTRVLKSLADEIAANDP